MAEKKKEKSCKTGYPDTGRVKGSTFLRELLKDSLRHVMIKKMKKQERNSMKARIRIKKEPERVLYYSEVSRPERAEELCRVAKELGIEFVILNHSDFEQKLGFLAGLSGYQERKREATELEDSFQELMVMSLQQERVNQFLSALERQKVEKVALKAVVTPHNRDWTLSQLLHEIAEEHRLFEAYEKLRETVISVQKRMEKGEISSEKQETLSLWIQKAKGISSLKEMTLEKLKEISQGIEGCLEEQ